MDDEDEGLDGPMSSVYTDVGMRSMASTAQPSQLWNGDLSQSLAGRDLDALARGEHPPMYVRGTANLASIVSIDTAPSLPSHMTGGRQAGGAVKRPVSRQGGILRSSYPRSAHRSGGVGGLSASSSASSLANKRLSTESSVNDVTLVQGLTPYYPLSPNSKQIVRRSVAARGKLPQPMRGRNETAYTHNPYAHARGSNSNAKEFVQISGTKPLYDVKGGGQYVTASPARPATALRPLTSAGAASLPHSRGVQKGGGSIIGPTQGKLAPASTAFGLSNSASAGHLQSAPALVTFGGSCSRIGPRDLGGSGSKFGGGFSTTQNTRSGSSTHTRRLQYRKPATYG